MALHIRSFLWTEDHLFLLHVVCRRWSNSIDGVDVANVANVDGEYSTSERDGLLRTGNYQHAKDVLFDVGVHATLACRVALRRRGGSGHVDEVEDILADDKQIERKTRTGEPRSKSWKEIARRARGQRWAESEGCV